MRAIYPPDAGPDPFVYVGNRSAAVARTIVGRFLAGESIADLAEDYSRSGDEVERILRWEIARRRTRRKVAE